MAYDGACACGGLIEAAPEPRGELFAPGPTDTADRLRRLTAEPLHPGVAQSACDVGLFSDDALQLDLVDQARKP